MSEKTHMSCNQCNASFVVDVFALGHREKDGLQCDCCGHWVLPEEKRTKSYSIVQVIRHGNIRPKRTDLEQYVGRTLRFERGNECFVGTVSGQSEAVFATAKGPIFPWAVVSETTEYYLDPEDRWNVCGCQSA